jgi:hypothetical protein
LEERSDDEEDVVGDFWTPRAAQQSLWDTTQVTPKKGAELFERVGNMNPSKSSIDGLPDSPQGRVIAQRRNARGSRCAHHGV